MEIVYEVVKYNIDSWDPMRFFPSAPPDEYDWEIQEICNKIIHSDLLSEDKVIELSVYIGDLCDGSDRLYDSTKYLEITKKILKEIKQAKHKFKI